MSINKDLTSKANYSDELSHTFWGYIASYISAIFSPPLVVVYAVALSAPFLNVPLPLLWSVMFMLLFIAPPALFVYKLLKKGVISDFHMINRKERIKPLVVITLNTLLGIYIFHIIGAPPIHILISISSFLSILIIFIITLFWKISVHSVAISGLCIVTMSQMSDLTVPFAMLIPIVAWSRVQLSHHTVLQTIAGVFLGILTFGVPFYFSGLL